MKKVLDGKAAEPIKLRIRSFKKEGTIATALLQEHHLQSCEDIGFMPIGLDEPYRIVVGNNPVNLIDPLGLWYVDIGFNIPIHPVFGGISIDIQIGPGGPMIVPGLYIGTPGVSAMVVTGDPTAGFQSSISGGYWVGGILTSYGQSGPYSVGFGFSTPGAAVEIFQYGIPIHDRAPPEGCRK